MVGCTEAYVVACRDMDSLVTLGIFINQRGKVAPLLVTAHIFDIAALS